MSVCLCVCVGSKYVFVVCGVRVCEDTSQVAYGGRAQGRRERAQAAALAYGEVLRMDPGLARHLAEVRDSSVQRAIL